MAFEIEKIAQKLDSSLTQGFEIERIANATGATITGFEIEQIAENCSSGSGGSGDAFEMARSILNRTITEYADSQITEIGMNAFCNCQQLSVVSIPNVSIIYGCAFMTCTSLTEIELPQITLIGTQAFAYCTKLSAIKMNVSIVPTISGSGYTAPFSNCASNLTFYVPESMISAFQAASGWSSMASKFSAIQS